MLIEYLKLNTKIDVYQAESDADELIVSTAIQQNLDTCIPCVVGKDTDLLISLFTRARHQIFMLKPSTCSNI